ncbi:hypothetical protein PSHT_07286 [Puccinia striiformis]|uniref:Uncharacterized protein n=1 Tax=Puccinia striiformis TaxID=27350 RepID=A0A2S4VZA6_9BASI|nr:hypothetical protein PSHT_07286 [Puccinia striiformis]
MYLPKSAYLHESIETIESEDFFDVLIIGGGPHALGLAARLRGASSSSTLYGYRAFQISVSPTTGCRQNCTIHMPFEHPFQINLENKPGTNSTTILSRDYWRLMEVLRNGLDDGMASSTIWISLTSEVPMFFHPSPADVDGLEAFAKRMDREKECVDSGGVEDVLPTVGQSKRGGDKIRKRATRKKGCVKSSLGAEINERDRSSYARPSSGVFRDFCKKELVERYGLEPVLRQDTVKSISYGDLHIKTEGRGRGFMVITKEGKRYGAKFVVMSIGGQESPAIPKCISDCTEAGNVMMKHKSAHQGPGWCHSRCFSYGGTHEFKQAVKTSKSTNQGTIVVIGGGLTSAQIADLAIRKGAAKVVLVCRGYLKTKHYDFPLSWVTKYSNLEKMSFWQENCSMARLKMVRQARNGGSVNPSTLLLLKKRVAEGSLSLRTHTTVTHAKRDSSTGRWTLQLIHHPPNISKPLEETIPEVLEDVTFVVAATGGRLDFGSISFLSSLLHPESEEPKQENHLMSTKQSVDVPGIIEGLPVLTEDLQWGKELPLFVMGAYAALELGPDAANLSGSRGGAERIGSKLNELLDNPWFLDSQLARSPPANSKESTRQSRSLTKTTSSPLLPTELLTLSLDGIYSSAEESPAESLTDVQATSEHQHDDSQETPQDCSTRRGRCAFRMGARERRAGNVGGWYAGLEEVVI